MTESKPSFAFESLIDQEKPVRYLTASIRNQTLPHAFLFTGVQGIGKRTAAITFAMACNCLERKAGEAPEKTATGNPGEEPGVGPCGRCRSCRKISTGNHPDVSLIRPEGVYIKIDQIRGLCRRLAIRPNEAKVRVVVVVNAGALNPEAGNALLKVLEEPPADTVMILTAVQRTDLLPTIVSRCQHIRFNPISRENLERILVDRYGAAPERARLAAAMAGGSIAMAVQMNRSDWLHKRTWLINAMTATPDMPMAARLALSEMISKKKETLLEALDLMQCWLRDAVVFPHAPDKIINLDLADRLRGVARNEIGLLETIDMLRAARRQLEMNANPRLVMDSVILNMMSTMRHPAERRMIET